LISPQSRKGRKDKTGLCHFYSFCSHILKIGSTNWCRSSRSFYRRHIYDAGAISRPDRMLSKVIDDKVVEKNKFEVSRVSRFKYRIRYFTASGIIGSKAFVAENFQQFKHLFYSWHAKSPNGSRVWRGSIR
jgi:hypothetical protein